MPKKTPPLLFTPHELATLRRLKAERVQKKRDKMFPPTTLSFRKGLKDGIYDKKKAQYGDALASYNARIDRARIKKEEYLRGYYDVARRSIMSGGSGTQGNNRETFDTDD